ncbi:hypothetical protein EON63_04705 [archaeon]|nr:MAG: hypothetical protein EON63_04705 [archaeon]
MTRLAAIEDMAGMSILCSDKTGKSCMFMRMCHGHTHHTHVAPVCVGTLTMNKMMIQEFTPIYKEGESQYTLLRYTTFHTTHYIHHTPSANTPYIFHQHHTLYTIHHTSRTI